MKSKKKSRRINSYEKPKTVKQQVVFPYKRVRIDWIDIITEGGWGSENEFKSMKLATPVSEGWLFSKDDETVSCLLYTSPSPRDATLSRMPSSA